MSCLNLSLKGISLNSLMFFAGSSLHSWQFFCIFSNVFWYQSHQSYKQRENHLPVVLILNAAKFPVPTCCFLFFLPILNNGFMDTSINLKNSDFPPKPWERVQRQKNSHLDFPLNPEKLEHKVIKVQSFGPKSSTTGNAPDLPPPSTATAERYCSSIGLVWMAPYGCPSASQMLLPFFSNCTQTLDSLFTQGTDRSISKPGLPSPAIIYFLPAVW